MTPNPFSIEGKVAVVTGGSRGIGLMIAEGFVDAGARVYITSRKAEVCDRVAAELSAKGECISIPADLSSEAEAQRFAEAVADRESSVHVLVNNAGATWGAPLSEYPDSAFDKIWAINVKAIFHLTRLLLPQLKKDAGPDDPGHVINIGSIDGLRVPWFENYAYSASKAAVHMLTRHLAHALVGDHVNVNAIAPGLFPSNMTKFVFETAEEMATSQIPMGRAGEAGDIAGVAIFLASRASAYMTGAVLPVDGGVSTR